MDPIETLLAKAKELPLGTGKVELLEQAVDVADRKRDLRHSYLARLHLCEAAGELCLGNRVLTALAWLLAHESELDAMPPLDVEPSYYAYPSGLLLWSRGVSPDLASFHELTRTQIDGILEQLAALFRKHGASPKHIHFARARAGIQMGASVECVQQHFQLQQQAQHDRHSCPGCDIDLAVEFALYRGDIDTARHCVSERSPVAPACKTSKHTTPNRLLRALLVTGHEDVAAQLFRQHYPHCRGKSAFTQTVGRMLLYANRTGRVDSARDIVEQHLGFIFANQAAWARLRFFIGTAAFLRNLSRQQSNASLQLPQDLPLWREDGLYDLAALANWFEDESRRLSRLLDERNGNSRCTDQFLVDPPLWY